MILTLALRKSLSLWYLSFFISFTSVTLIIAGCDGGGSSSAPIPQGYTVTRVAVLDGGQSLTNARFPNRPFHNINDAGQIVWQSYDGSQWNIWLQRMGESRRLNGDHPGLVPQLNEAGDVLWMNLQPNTISIFREAGTSTFEGLGPYNFEPRANNRGDVVWVSGATQSLNIYLLKDGVVSRLTSSGLDLGIKEIDQSRTGLNFMPQINDIGQIVWKGYDEKGLHVYLYQDGIIKTIMDLPGFSWNRKHFHPHKGINNQGQVVSVSGSGASTELCLYKEGVVEVLSSGQYYRYPEINENGQVVWQGFDGKARQIYLYDGKEVRCISTGTLNEFPHINDSGQVVWQSFDGQHFQIMLYENGRVRQLTETDVDAVFPVINNAGQIVWATRVWDDRWLYQALYAATPPGMPPYKGLVAESASSLPASQTAIQADASAGTSLPAGKQTSNLSDDSNPFYYPERKRVRFAFFADTRGADMDPFFIKGDEVNMGFLKWFSSTMVYDYANWMGVWAGGNHTLGWKFDNSLWSWGKNDHGQLGVGHIPNQENPVKVMERVQQACGGGNHSAAIDGHGKLYTWGENSSGQLGVGSYEDKYVPVQVGNNEEWTHVCAGERHTVAIQRDGSLWAWGSNEFGQLGNGRGAQSVSPARVGSTNDWLTVACGGNHTLALKKDYSLWAWGRNDRGQLGLGNRLQQDTPAQVGTSTEWRALSLGGNFSSALREDHGLYTWGAFDSGRLGDGSQVDRLVPARIEPRAKFSRVSAGQGHAVALGRDGTLWAWGQNDYGQVGDGTTDDAWAPVQITKDSNWFQVSAGGHHTMASKKGSTLMGWGAHGFGQLGNGYYYGGDSFAPVAQGLDFIVFGGDMSNVASHNFKFKEAASALIKSGIPIYPVFGNHEAYQIFPGEGHPARLQAWIDGKIQLNTALPQNCAPLNKNVSYAFRWGETLFVVLNTHYFTEWYPATPECLKNMDMEQGYVSDEQLIWLKNSILQVKDYSEAPNKIVFGHAPAFGTNTDHSKLQSSMKEMWKTLDANLFDAYLCGHEHVFAARQIQNSDCQTFYSDQGCDNYYNQVLQLVVGTSGAHPDSADKYLEEFVNSWNVKFDFSYAMVTIGGDRIDIEARKVVSDEDGNYSDAGTLYSWNNR